LFYYEIRWSADGGQAALQTVSTSLHFGVQFAAGYNQQLDIEAESVYKELKKRNKQKANIVHVMSYWTQIWRRPRFANISTKEGIKKE